MVSLEISLSFTANGKILLVLPRDLRYPDGVRVSLTLRLRLSPPFEQTRDRARQPERKMLLLLFLIVSLCWLLGGTCAGEAVLRGIFFLWASLIPVILLWVTFTITIAIFQLEYYILNATLHN